MVPYDKGTVMNEDSWTMSLKYIEKVVLQHLNVAANIHRHAFWQKIKSSRSLDALKQPHTITEVGCLTMRMANLGSYRFEVKGRLTSAEAFRKVRRSYFVRPHDIRPLFSCPMLVSFGETQSSPMHALVQSRFACSLSTREENLLLETMLNSANENLFKNFNIFSLNMLRAVCPSVGYSRFDLYAAGKSCGQLALRYITCLILSTSCGKSTWNIVCSNMTVNAVYWAHKNQCPPVSTSQSKYPACISLRHAWTRVSVGYVGHGWAPRLPIEM